MTEFRQTDANFRQRRWGLRTDDENVNFASTCSNFPKSEFSVQIGPNVFLDENCPTRFSENPKFRGLPGPSFCSGHYALSEWDNDVCWAIEEHVLKGPASEYRSSVFWYTRRNKISLSIGTAAGARRKSNFRLQNWCHCKLSVGMAYRSVRPAGKRTDERTNDGYVTTLKHVSLHVGVSHATQWPPAVGLPDSPVSWIGLKRCCKQSDRGSKVMGRALALILDSVSVGVRQTITRDTFALYLSASKRFVHSCIFLLLRGRGSPMCPVFPQRAAI